MIYILIYHFSLILEYDPSKHWTLTDNELKSKSVEIMVRSFTLSAEDPINNLVVQDCITPGNKVRDLSKQLLQMQKDKGFIDTCEKFVFHIFNMIKRYNMSKDTEQEKFWSAFHLFNVKLEANKLWFDFMCEKFSQQMYHSATFKSLIFFVSRQIVLAIISIQNTLNNQKPATMDELKLTDDEQQIIRYVAGYVVFSLKNKYNKIKYTTKSPKSRQVADASLTLLNSLVITSDENLRCKTFLEFTNKWIELVNRGGLIRVSDDMFIFIRRIENIARQTLNIPFLKSYKGEDLRDIINKQLQESSLIANSWESLSRLMPNRKLASLLRSQILSKWIDIRARSFVDTYVQIVKNKLRDLKKKNIETNVKVSKKAQPAMRKTLT